MGKLCSQIHKCHKELESTSGVTEPTCTAFRSILIRQTEEPRSGQEPIHPPMGTDKVENACQTQRAATFMDKQRQEQLRGASLPQKALAHRLSVQILVAPDRAFVTGLIPRLPDDNPGSKIQTSLLANFFCHTLCKMGCTHPVIITKATV